MKRLSVTVGNILEKNILYVQLRCINFKIFVLVENPDCYFDSNKCGWEGHSDWQQSTDQPNDKIPPIVETGIQKISEVVNLMLCLNYTALHISAESSICKTVISLESVLLVRL